MADTKISLLSRLDSLSARFLINSLDKADPRGLQHALCVAEVAYDLARALNHNRFKADEVWLAALLHDIGHLGIPRAIFESRGKLTKHQKQQVEQHPLLGKFLIDRMFDAPHVSRAVLCHHERPDGSGYPSKLAGDKIPFMSLVIAVADSYDAMRSAFWLLKKKTHDDAIKELEANAGPMFDVDVVGMFRSRQDHIFTSYENAMKLTVKDVLKRI